MNRITQYSKAIAATLAAIATWGITATGADGSITQEEWWGLLGVLGAAIATWGVTNTQAPEPPDDTYMEGV